MGLSHAPSVVTNSLVLYYDMGNSQKSWKGAPTTNLISISGWNTNFNGTSPYWATMTRTMITSDLLFSGVNIGQGVTSTAASYGFGYIDFPLPTGTTAGVTYACSFWYKSTSRTASVWCHDTAGANTVYSSTLPADGKWNRGVAVFTSTTTGYVRLHFHMNAGAVGDVVNFTAPMIEQQSFGTPFVNGARSSAQALIDIVGNNTLTANNLVYNSNGTFEFNGTNSLVTAPDADNFSFPSQTFAFDYWVYFNNTTSLNGIIGKGEGSWEYAIYANGTNGLIFYSWPLAGSGPVYTPPITTTFNAGQWYHHCWTANGANSYLYVNGVLTGTNSKGATYSMASGTNRLTIGAAGDSGGLKYLNGKLENVKIYNRYLTPAEVLQNFNALRGRYGV